MHRYLGWIQVVCIIILFCPVAQSQTPMRTMGKEFWLGYFDDSKAKVGCFPSPEIPSDRTVLITSPYSTVGKVSIPGAGWDTVFQVLPASATLIALPQDSFTQIPEGTVYHNGILIEADQEITVSATVAENFSADASRILPTSALGTEYIVASYYGMPSYWGCGMASVVYTDFSQLTIVGTQENTAIEITPACHTLGGNMAGISFTIYLDRGDTYTLSGMPDHDLTGTIIKGVGPSASCSPFAVFSGASATDVPDNCTAADQIFEQCIPVDSWGMNYQISPFIFDLSPVTDAEQASYTFRILAGHNNTTVSVDGGEQLELHKGEFIEFNNVTSAHSIQASHAVSLIQYMEGLKCGGNGDPFMLILDDESQGSNEASFATLGLPDITHHYLSLVIPVSVVTSVKLDNEAIDPSSFQVFSSSPGWLWGVVEITPGYHTIRSSAGDIRGVVYGVGSYVSYSYSLSSGSFRTDDLADQVICSGVDAELQMDASYLSPVWYHELEPDSILSNEHTYDLPAGARGIYIGLGTDPISGCLEQTLIRVEDPGQHQLAISPGSTIDICQHQTVQLEASICPPPSVEFEYSWEPQFGLSDPSIANPLATPLHSSTYTVTASSIGGCAVYTAQTAITVSEGVTVRFEIASSDSVYCNPQEVPLTIYAEQELWFDDFDSGASALIWDTISNGGASSFCGSVAGKSLLFDGTGERFATTHPINCMQGGTLYFSLKIAGPSSSCDDTEWGDNVIIEYSTGEDMWHSMTTYYEAMYPDFLALSVEIPPSAQSEATLFRWKQVGEFFTGQDQWALDNVYIGLVTNDYSCVWSPAPGLSDSLSHQPLANITESSFYHVSTIGVELGCTYQDSIRLELGTFQLNGPQEILACAFEGIQLNATPQSEVSADYSFVWTPHLDIVGSDSPTPIVSPASETVYHVVATSHHGCTAEADFVVHPAPEIVHFGAFPEYAAYCVSDTVALSAKTEWVIWSDDFDPFINDTMWSGLVNATRSDVCGSIIGNGLYFQGTSERSATTKAVNCMGGGTIYFSLKISGPGGTCNDAEAGDDIVLEYSTDETNWFAIETYDESQFPQFVDVQTAIPPVAQSAGTFFRWRQLGSFTQSTDQWVLDNIFIGVDRTNDYSYSWTPEVGLSNSNIHNPLASPLVPTMYYVNMEDEFTGCHFLDSVFVDVGQPFSISTSPDTLMCRVGGIGLNAMPESGSATQFKYQWTPILDISGSTTSAPIVDPKETTTYHVTVTSSQGCTTEDDVTVSVRPLLHINALPESSAVCGNDAVELNVQTERIVLSDNFDAQISPSLWSSINNGAVSDICGSMSGMGLRFSGSGYRNASTIPINCVNGGTIRFSLKICNGYGAGNCRGSGPSKKIVLIYTYLINGFIPASGTIEVFPQSTFDDFTTYEIPIPIAARTAATRFTWSQEVQTPNSVDDIWVLDDVSISVPTTGEFSFLWSPVTGLDNPFAQAPFANPSAATAYTVEVSDLQNGCKYMDKVFVNVGENPILEVSNDTTLCQLTEIELHASPVNMEGIDFQYDWTPMTDAVGIPDSVLIVKPQVTTTYHVVATSSEGCRGEADVVVTIGGLDDYRITKESGIACSTDSLWISTQIERVVLEDDFDPGVSPIAWESVMNGYVSGSNDPIATSLCGSVSGNALYFNGGGTRLAETNAVDCSNGGTIRFSIKFGSGSYPCTEWHEGDDVVLQYSTIWNNWVTMYPLSPVLYPDFTDVVRVIPAAAMGPQTRFRWWQLGFPIDDVSIWMLDNVSISTLSPESYLYTWTPAEGLSNPAISSPQAYPQHSTMYYLHAENPYGCTYEDSVYVEVGAPYNLVTTQDTTLCEIKSIPLSALPQTESVSGYSFKWTPNINALISGVHTSTPIVTALSTTVFNVIVTSPEGCSVEDEVIVTVNPLQLDLSSNIQSVCLGDSVILNSTFSGDSQSALYSWLPSSSLSSPSEPTTVAYPLDNTIYTLTAQHQPTGCVLEDEIYIEVVPQFTIDVEPDSIAACIIEGIQLETSSDFESELTWYWHPHNMVTNTTVANPQLTAIASGYLVLTGMSEEGCTGSDTIFINPLAETISIGPDITLCSGEFATLYAELPNDYDFLWSTGDETSFITVFEEGLYSVQVVNPDGCVSEDELFVNIFEPPVITSQPVDQYVSVNSNVVFIASSTQTGLTFQWQENSGSGFEDLENGAPYYGANGSILSINQVSSFMDGHQYQCIIASGDCADTSEVATLHVNLTGLEANISDRGLIVFPNPAGNSFTVQTSSVNIGAPVRLFDSTGRLVYETRLERSVVTISTDHLSSGLYLIQVNRHSTQILEIIR